MIEIGTASEGKLYIRIRVKIVDQACQLYAVARSVGGDVSPKPNGGAGVRRRKVDLQKFVA
jgi:hypothetical protein